MKSRNMQNGVEKVAELLARNTDEASARQWRDLRNKIDSILLSTTAFKTDDVRTACHKIDDMPAEQRADYIKEKWGPICYSKIEPLLLQLQFLENRMSG